MGCLIWQQWSKLIQRKTRADSNQYSKIFWAKLKLKFDFFHYSTGKLVRTIKIPAETVTGAVYGGKHLDKLFVTTTVRKSNFYGQSEPDSKNPDSGKIFMIEGLGSQGCTGRPAKNVYNHNIEIESEFFQMLNWNPLVQVALHCIFWILVIVHLNLKRIEWETIWNHSDFR